MEQHKTILTIFEKLEAQKIGYVVLRNYLFLLEGREPQQASEKSVDMMVSEDDYARFDLLMRENGFQQRQQQFSHAHKAYFMIHKLKSISFDVQIGGIYWNDMKYLSAEDVLSQRQKLKSFYVLHDDDVYVMLLLHSVLGKRYFKKEYAEILLKLRNSIDQDIVQKKLQRTLPKYRARWLFSLAQENNFDKIISQKYVFIFSFIFSSPKNVAIFTALFFRWIKWKKFFRNYPLISVIGPNGAGKSTLVAALVQYLQKHNRKAVQIYTGRGRGQLLPFQKLGNAYKHKERKKDKQQRPSLWKRKIAYTLAAPIFALDLGIRYLFLIWPLRQRRTIVITDRYCTDILLMPNVPFWLRYFLFRLFPKPTKTFYLYNSPEVLHERRPEESSESLQKQLMIFDQMKGYLKTHKVLTNETEKVQEEVFTAVMNYLYKEWF